MRVAVPPRRPDRHLSDVDRVKRDAVQHHHRGCPRRACGGDQGEYAEYEATHSSTHVYERTDPGRAVNDRPLYRLPWSAVFPYAIASPAIGAATGALELFIENNRERVSVAGGRTVSASPGLHLRLAESLTEVEAARTRLALTWQDFHARVTRGEEIPYVLRTRCRYDAAHALAHCAGAVYRLLRDLLAMRNHIAATLEINASAYALAKLGAPPPPFIRSQRVVI